MILAPYGSSIYSKTYYRRGVSASSTLFDSSLAAFSCFRKTAQNKAIIWGRLNLLELKAVGRQTQKSERERENEFGFTMHADAQMILKPLQLKGASLDRNHAGEISK